MYSMTTVFLIDCAVFGYLFIYFPEKKYFPPKNHHHHEKEQNTKTSKYEWSLLLGYLEWHFFSGAVLEVE